MLNIEDVYDLIVALPDETLQALGILLDVATHDNQHLLPIHEHETATALLAQVNMELEEREDEEL